jgi:hypothetical protein
MGATLYHDLFEKNNAFNDPLKIQHCFDIIYKEALFPNIHGHKEYIIYLQYRNNYKVFAIPNKSLLDLSEPELD